MSKKNILLIVSLSIFIIFLLILIVFLLKNPNKMQSKTKETDIIFNFVDETRKEKDIDVFTDKFEPDEVNITIDGVNKSNLVMVDDSRLDLNKVGKYEVKYYFVYNDERYEQIQIINIVDNEPPIITLEGNSVVILVGEKYNEPGYKALDNYDGDIKEKVEIKSSIDNTKPGDYTITYIVADSSDNKSEVSRKVTVKKPNVVVATPPKETKVETPKIVETDYSNTLKKNKFNSNSIHFEGYIKNVLDENRIRLVGEETYDYDINVDNNNYSIDINIEEISNGKYKVYINEEPLYNKIAPIERLSRGKVGSKLVTFNYGDKGEISVEMADHNYQYDILINPGHGGEDTGAVNQYIAEKEMNLTVSMYEKCRYESHGLRVYMTRTSDTYGATFGPEGLIKLHKLGYEMGYYGAVSKIVYSNHHNSIGNNYYSGYEILVAGSLTSDQLATELSIANKLNSIFDLKENHKRFYARNYDTDAIFSKLNGEVYTFKDYYAINRIPLTISNVKSIIYEGCYMSNKEEFNWYWQLENWYRVSEAKIEAYVTSLGLTYSSDNSDCL